MSKEEFIESLKDMDVFNMFEMVLNQPALLQDLDIREAMKARNREIANLT